MRAEKILLFVFLVLPATFGYILLASSPGFAGTCPTATGTTPYFTIGFSCVIGDKLFSDFGGFTALQTGSSFFSNLTVVPDATPFPGFRFLSGQTIPANLSGQAGINYTVSDVHGIATIQDVSSALFGSVFSGTGSISSTVTASEPGGIIAGTTSTSVDSSGGLIFSEANFLPVSKLFATTFLNMNGGSDGATLYGMSTHFSSFSGLGAPGLPEDLLSLKTKACDFATNLPNRLSGTFGLTALAFAPVVPPPAKGVFALVNAYNARLWFEAGKQCIDPFDPLYTSPVQLKIPDLSGLLAQVPPDARVTLGHGTVAAADAEAANTSLNRFLSAQSVGDVAAQALQEQATIDFVRFRDTELDKYQAGLRQLAGEFNVSVQPADLQEALALFKAQGAGALPPEELAVLEAFNMPPADALPDLTNVTVSDLPASAAEAFMTSADAIQKWEAPSPVPEPPGAVLMLIGLLALALTRKRRRLCRRIA
ncbi:MAG TPA: PEP-CTERM sorting domain-containing protein [bacterium]|nr:PEP-CTERM sorting domain-containing protein [bacterium]